MRRSPIKLPGNLASSARHLWLEVLEVRAMLAGDTPWQNSAFRFDVNKDGIVTATDMVPIVNRLNSVGIAPLPDLEGQTPPFYYDVDGDNWMKLGDLITLINRLNKPTNVTLTTMAPFAYDLTPQVTVAVSGPAAVPNGTTAWIDVDLNGNGKYTDPGETNYAQGTIFKNSATFEIRPGLPPSAATSTYTLKLRAHVQDADGVVGYSAALPLVIDSQTSDVLKNYVTAADPSYKYELRNVTTSPIGLYTVYDISMTSQTWRTTADVNQPEWKHWVRVIVPALVTSSTALFLIDGGSYSETPPSTSDPEFQAYVQAAVLLKAVLVDLKDVPNEPLEFTGDDPPRQRSEDAIIAYTYDQFMNHLGQPGNETWPALLPMVKSAVRGMDTVQSFVPTVVPGRTITDFIVTGYSKRGWTTWLTSAVDSRVSAIIPGVFDNLNQGPQMVHQQQVYGFFSPAVDDYNELHIFDRLLTPAGQVLGRIVDPYTYLDNGRFDNMPKLLLNSAGDEFFVSDSSQYYIHDLPGTQNYLRYFPNTGHGLDLQQAANSTITFYDAIVNKRTLPQFLWLVQADGSIRVDTTTAPSAVKLWQATNPTARDFRHAYNPTIQWTSSTLTPQSAGVYVGDAGMPANGARAYFVELTFPSSVPGIPYVFTTEIHVKSTLPLFPWPFYPNAPLPGVAGAAAISQDEGTALSSLASAITSTTSSKPLDAPSAAAAVSLAATELLPAPPAIDEALTGEIAVAVASSSKPRTKKDAVDSVFDLSLDEVLA